MQVLVEHEFLGILLVEFLIRIVQASYDIISNVIVYAQSERVSLTADYRLVSHAE